MRKRIARALALVVVAALAGPAFAADDFYGARLQEGRIALQTGSASEAADLLRIGCFGLMDQPELLTEGLRGRDKLLMLTGTPVRNGPTDAAPLMNALLFQDPSGRRVPTSAKAFNQSYVDERPVSAGFLRPSGTEPKLKIYYFASDASRDKAAHTLERLKASMAEKMQQAGI